ncbi:hypothetical protein [Psychrobacter alimentarius]|uniref:hypothetical protein n=1 Tax=Psychrobacter alimentarius TaxID=261164 RepID=UPI00191A9A19|nr:hypothetical protein [Psychrobacter alimentarius]
MNKQETVYKTSLVLVEHFLNCIERKKLGINLGVHSRIFSYILHPEVEFVTVGKSQEVADGAPPHPEHVVPCSIIIWESIRLLEEGKPKEEVAKLIAKHWKIVFISKDESSFIDSKKGLNLKSSMPDNWDFETGDSFERLNLAGIQVLPLD